MMTILKPYLGIDAENMIARRGDLVFAFEGEFSRAGTTPSQDESLDFWDARICTYSELEGADIITRNGATWRVIYVKPGRAGPDAEPALYTAYVVEAPDQEPSGLGDWSEADFQRQDFSVGD